MPCSLRTPRSTSSSPTTGCSIFGSAATSRSWCSTSAVSATAWGCGLGAHAAFVGRRRDRLRQVGVHHVAGDLPGNEQYAGRFAHGDDRLEDGRAAALQRPAAPVWKSRDEY